MKVMITKRDKEILNMVNRFGKCTVENLAMYIGKSVSNTRKIIFKLVKAGLLERVRLFHNRSSILRCSDEGAAMTIYGNNVEIKLSRIEHDLCVNDIFFEYNQMIRHECFYTDRDMKMLKLFEEHRPDIVFALNGKYTAIEVELNRKSDIRMAAIRKFYEYNEAFERIIYLVQEPQMEAFLSNYFKYYEKFEVLNFSKNTNF